jgi:hypothetical protein
MRGCYADSMGRTALYRDPVPYKPARAEAQVDHDALVLRMPDGRTRRYALDGSIAAVADGCVAIAVHGQRRFVRMLIIERGSERHTVITPPDQGAVAPGVVRVPEAPVGAPIVEARAWTAIAEWIMGGGRLAACSIAELARLAAIATPQFAVVIGEVVAQRAREAVWMAAHPLRGVTDLDTVLQPLVDAARESPQAAEALVAALACAAIPLRRRR